MAAWGGFNGEIPPMRILEFMEELVRDWSPAQISELSEAILTVVVLECEKDDEALMGAATGTPGTMKGLFDDFQRLIEWLASHSTEKIYSAGVVSSFGAAGDVAADHSALASGYFGSWSLHRAVPLREVQVGNEGSRAGA